MPRAVWALLARPELLLAVPLLVVPLGLMAKRTVWRTKLLWIVAGGVAAAVVVAPWIGYNMTRFNAPVTFSTNAGGTMAAANCDSTYYGDIIGYKDYDCAHAVWLAAAARDPHWEELDASQKDDEVRHEATLYIRDHLRRVPVVVLARWARILGLYKPFQEVGFDEFLLKQETAVGYSIVWGFWAFAIAAIAGLVVMVRRRLPVWPLLAFPVIVLVAVGITFAQTRYRAPMEVSVVLLAAVAIDAWYQSWRARRSRGSLPDPDEEPTVTSEPDPAVQPVST